MEMYLAMIPLYIYNFQETHMYICMCPYIKNLYMNVHHQIIHDSPKVELTQMWIKMTKKI